jgi:hypothetical protein
MYSEYIVLMKARFGKKARQTRQFGVEMEFSVWPDGRHEALLHITSITCITSNPPLISDPLLVCYR